MSQTLYDNQPEQLQNLMVAWVAWLNITRQVCLGLVTPNSLCQSVQTTFKFDGSLGSLAQYHQAIMSWVRQTKFKVKISGSLGSLAKYDQHLGNQIDI